ncbi:hypothetical protein DWW10_04850 [Bacteroides intestinalis]|uniref:Uncharacterized protein n=1 Tax=Bacteroides intestinalis TaxID=329854 RepID=A0A412YIW9_9BACE|nr:hypothetical protein [Bacteroides intestinalis]RGV57370.1 hypothetical protein DWW10_04850 [Bacteroides intestinalis]RHA61781.1 hypothetical protein DW932_06250 [Bacteroides intestinalis]
MSKIIYLLAMTIIVSCSSTRILEGIAIYECERVGESFPSYIVLKGGPLRQCDFIEFGYGTIATYAVEKDTLYVFPKFRYSSDSIYYLDTLNDKSQKFLIKQDRLIQITDYSLEEINDSADYYVNEFLKSLPPIEYMKLEIKK